MAETLSKAKNTEYLDLLKKWDEENRASQPEEISNAVVGRRLDDWLDRLSAYLEAEGRTEDEQLRLGHLLKVMTHLRPGTTQPKMIRTGSSPAHRQITASVLIKADENQPEARVSDMQIADALEISRRTIIRIKARLFLPLPPLLPPSHCERSGNASNRRHPRVGQ